MAGNGFSRIVVLFLIILAAFGSLTASAQPPSPPQPQMITPVPTPPPQVQPPQASTQIQSPPAVPDRPPTPSQVRPPQGSPPTPPQPASGSLSGPPPTGIPEQVPSPRPLAKKGEVSFNFDDADVYSVIQTIFGGVLQVNYIIDPKVKGRVNFRSVAPVAKGDVLPLMEVILRLNGIGVVEEGGLYRIVPIADMPREPAPVKIGREAEKVNLQGLGLLQVVPLNYLPSSEMVKVLTPFLSTNAVIVDVPKINYLILVDTDANVKRLLQLVEIFDSEKLKKIKPQVFVYPVQNAKAKDLAGLLNQIFLGALAPPRTPTTTTPGTQPRPGTTPGQPGPTPLPTPSTIGTSLRGETLVSEITRIYSDEITNSLIILATPEDYTMILETLKKLDQVPRQVMIEVLIAEITLTDDLKFGLEWAIRSKMDSGFVSLTGAFTPSTTGTPPSGTVIPPTGFTFLGIDPTGLIRGTLNTLATQGKTNVLASPHIMAADNREAKIQIGSQIPVVTNTVTTGVVSGAVQYKDTGVILKIKPFINDSGLVSMEMTQEVSNYHYQNIGGADYPVIDKREATTYMVVQDGQTVVVGGLIQENIGRTRAGIPFLSKIPVLGYLFGYTSDTFRRSEIILLLTPRVVRNQKEAEHLTNIYIHRLDKSFETQLNKDRILPKEP